MSRQGGARAAKKVQDLGKILMKEELTAKYRQISEILSIPCERRSEAQKQTLNFSPEIVSKWEKNRKKRESAKARIQEVPDSAEVLEDKCLKLAAAIHRSGSLVVYTGAGISTSANIPDYRGPNGVWTLKDKGIDVRAKDLSDAEPTHTHMVLAQLMRLGKVKYIVSQNCDGLHVRSGVSRTKLSEIHGNMFIEVCPQCTDKHSREYIRLFDVTEKTGVRKHETDRQCHNCQTQLKDTIVHFGEKGAMTSPYNWEEARSAAESADMILCLGTSLKILKQYLCLWCMDRPKKKRPSIYIVNLQWTPKDDTAQMKIAGSCDDVMKRVMESLRLFVSPYIKYYDPLFTLHNPLKSEEYSTHNKKMLTRGDIVTDHTYCIVDPLTDQPSHQCVNRGNGDCIQPTAESSSPSWYGVGIRSAKEKRRRKF